MMNKCYCKRFVVKLSISGNDVTPYGPLNATFKLDDTPSYTDFTNMFDQYQLSGIAYRFVITKDDQAGSITAVNRGTYVRLMHVIDHNDSAQATAFTDIQQYPQMKENWLSDSRPVTKWYYQKPAVLTTVNSLIANNYNPGYNKWIDTGYPGTLHYGVKGYYEGHYAGRNLVMECKYYIKLKEIR